MRLGPTDEGPGHQALANRTPMSVWREGVTGGLDVGDVDMTLPFNAGAWPTGADSGIASGTLRAMPAGNAC